MDIVIVGGGSAGLSAALLLGRMRRQVVVLDSGAPRNRVAEHMHGLLGRDHTSPLDLLATGRKELERYGVTVRSDTATGVRRTEATGSLTVATGAGEELPTRRLLVATGLHDQLPEIEGLAEQWGRGVVVCPYCDGWELRDRPIGVLVTSPLGAHQAQLLRELSDQVTCFTGTPSPLDEQQSRELTARGITLDPRPIRRVVPGAGDHPIEVELDGGDWTALAGLFAGPQLDPQDSLLTALGAETTVSFGWELVATDHTGKTSVPGVWAAGNVVDPRANVPAAIAAGAAAGAALNADLIAEDTAHALASDVRPGSGA